MYQSNGQQIQNYLKRKGKGNEQEMQFIFVKKKKASNQQNRPF